MDDIIKVKAFAFLNPDGTIQECGLSDHLQIYAAKHSMSVDEGSQESVEVTVTYNFPKKEQGDTR